MSEVVGCAAYAAGRRVADLTVDELPQAADHPDWFVWIGLHEPGEALLKRLQAIFGLHDLAVEDAMCAHQRPKIEEYDDTVFVVLRTVQAVQPEAGKAPIQLGETHLFVGPRFVISVRHGASSSYAAVRTRCEATPGLLAKGPDFVLYAIMDFVVDRLLSGGRRSSRSSSAGSSTTSSPTCRAGTPRSASTAQARAAIGVKRAIRRWSRSAIGSPASTSADPRGRLQARTSATSTITCCGSTSRSTACASCSRARSRPTCR